jgi:hypothetical protein
MGGDDFSKAGDALATVNDDTFLGIRKAIKQRLAFHQETLDSEVKKLSKSMQIMEKIIEALDAGSSSLSIRFPVSLDVNVIVIGKISWRDVAKQLIKLLLKEGLGARFETEKGDNGEFLSYLRISGLKH